jgi:hypothetical protein
MQWQPIYFIHIELFLVLMGVFNEHSYRRYVALLILFWSVVFFYYFNKFKRSGLVNDAYFSIVYLIIEVITIIGMYNKFMANLIILLNVLLLYISHKFTALVHKNYRVELVNNTIRWYNRED